MRLIELRLQNLNSLKGEWHIDFNDDAFTSEGIFAITGQTGAGKTTILDAICLALYGETPRITSISKTSNEVMTRQTGECYAEVVIEIDGEHYRCRWGQRRSRGKAGGNLQNATHEVAKVNRTDPSRGDEILEEKLSRTKDKIVELTRMDFQQFTRSILLAQGSFSAFLKAKSDERADILEKITGTDIYATISKNVHEKRRIEEEKLKRLQASVDGLTLLDSDTVAQLQADLQTHQDTLNDKQTTLKTIDSQIKWLDDISELTGQAHQFQDTLAQAQQDYDGFADDKIRLENANRALELDSDYHKLIHSRDNVRALQDSTKDINTRLPTLQNDVAQLSKQVATSKQTEQTALYELNTALPLIAQTRKLDALISQHQCTLADYKTRASQLDNQIALLTSTLESHTAKQKQTHDQHQQISDYLTRYADYASLPADIETFDHAGKQLKKSLQANEQCTQDTSELSRKTAEYQTTLNKLNDEQQAHNHTIEQRNNDLSSLQVERDGKLQGQPLSVWREAGEHLESHLTKLENIKQKLTDTQNVLGQTSQVKHKLTEAKATLKPLQNDIAADEDGINALKEKRSEQQEKLTLLEQVAKLEDYIELLEDGKPCPLCGATEHPYRDAINHPLHSTHPLKVKQPATSSEDSNDQSTVEQSPIAQTKARIGELTTQIDQLEQTLEEKRITLATTKHNLDRFAEQISELAGQAKLSTNNGLNLLEELTKQVAELTNNSVLQLEKANSQPLLATLTQPLSDISSALNISTSDELHTHTIDNISELVNKAIGLGDDLAQNWQTQKDTIKTTLTEYEKLSNELDNVKVELAKLEADKHQLIQQISEVQTEQKLSEQRLDTIQTQIQNNFAEMTDALTTLQELARRYQTDGNTDDGNDNDINLTSTLDTLIASVAHKQILPANEYEGYLDKLREYRQQLVTLNKTFISKEQTSHELATALSTLATQIDNTNSQLNTAKDEQSKLASLIKTTQRELDNHIAKRQQIFADKEVDSEETRLRALLDGAKAKTHTAEQTYQSTQHRLEQLLEKQKSITAQLTTAKDELGVWQDKFKGLLADYKFADEAAFTNARLPKEERDALSHQYKTLSDALTQTQTQLTSVKQQLTDKQANPPAGINLKELQLEELQTGNTENSGKFVCNSTEHNPLKATLMSKQTQLSGEIEALNQDIGAIKQQLKDNDTRKGEQQAKLNAIHKQKEAMQVWLQLHELIGSSDGKKFRTFAQGLTFDVMVGHANIQLQKMSDRYLLVRDDDNPLELNVIDDYQGGEVRSTKNLSGGEGFIISLALALGLSQMASQQADKNIRVDSLFLDEGFGTLDEDSLDIALSTLTSLQQEGKLIGVISHVQALKERILTQIRVEKLSGGYSRIVGAGCSTITKLV